MSLIWIFIILIILSGAFGGSGLNTYGGYGWSPLGLILLVLLILALTGRIRF